MQAAKAFRSPRNLFQLYVRLRPFPSSILSRDTSAVSMPLSLTHTHNTHSLTRTHSLHFWMAQGQYGEETFLDLALEGSLGTLDPRSRKIFASTASGLLYQISYTSRTVEQIYRLHDAAIRALVVTDGWPAPLTMLQCSGGLMGPHPSAYSLWRAPFGVLPLACSLWRALFGVLPLACSLWRAPFGVFL